MYKEMLFRLIRHNSHDGLHFNKSTIEAECRHVTDVMALLEKRKQQEYYHDETGRRVYVRFDVVSIRTSEVLKQLTVGVI